MENLFYPRKARKYSDNCPNKFDQFLMYQNSAPKLPLLLDDCTDAEGRATQGAVAERAGVRRFKNRILNCKQYLSFKLVPKLQLGNSVREALASHTGWEARASKTAFPSWSLGTSVILGSNCLQTTLLISFVFFVDKYPFLK
ncbi:hypothetical protein [Methylobacter tundripaludum]|nr:hypothetical protein [Methylobacter tundripaludum]